MGNAAIGKNYPIHGELDDLDVNAEDPDEEDSQAHGFDHFLTVRLDLTVSCRIHSCMQD